MTAFDPAIYRDPHAVATLCDAILKTASRPCRLMEMCGGQTHALLKLGVDELLREKVTFIHGPGCPVCVTPAGTIDKAIQIAQQPETILTTYGDMLRVPGTMQSLAQARADGADVQIVYSSLNALNRARTHPDRQVVFFAIGCETTAPANAVALLQAESLKLDNFSLLCSQFRIPPALTAILEQPERPLDGFLAAGHVCAVMGTGEYHGISRKYQVPISVTGFEAVDLLLGVYQLVQALESKSYQVSNAYGRTVKAEGNPATKALIDKVFEPCDRDWRGIGTIPASGWRLKDQFAAYDADKRYILEEFSQHVASPCIAGEVLQGVKTPFDCPAYGHLCTPENPLGATMVSSEGTCAAYYRYRGVLQ